MIEITEETKPESITICAQCKNYLPGPSHDNRRCWEAKLLSVNQITGIGTWESNESKNNGRCPDFKERPWFGPEQWTSLGMLVLIIVMLALSAWKLVPLFTVQR